MFCDRCGQQFLPKESVCTRCGVAASRHWLQLASLATLTVAIVWNSLLALFFLSRLANGEQVPLFRGWLRFNDRVASHGWVAFALALLIWSFWARRGYSLPRREWVARWLLILLLMVGIVASPLPWLPPRLVSTLRVLTHDYPGLAPTLAWVLIVSVVGILCMNSETRDSLLGHGRALTLVSLGLLVLILGLMTLGWSATYR